MSLTKSRSLICAFFIVITICGCGTAKREEQEAAAAALKEIKRLGSYTEAGVDYSAYKSRVLDAKADVDDYLIKMAPSEAKESLQNALDAYVDAYQFWTLANERQGRRGYFNLTKKETEKYSIES